MDIYDSKCPICKWEERSTQENVRASLYQQFCPRCGPYRLHSRDFDRELGDDVRIAISYFTKTRFVRGQPVPRLHLRKGRHPKNAFTLDDIRAIAPDGIAEIQDQLLITLSQVEGGKRYGQFYAFDEKDTPIAFSWEIERFRFHTDQLNEAGFIEFAPETAGFSHQLEKKISEFQNSDLWRKEQLVTLREDHQNMQIVRLTNKGWIHAEELMRGITDTPAQAFVAMWFNPDLESAFLEGIEPAVNKAGYEAHQLAFLEHNDDVNDRIIAEIRKSRFIVADFTGNRGGVYFEAGLALGLGKPVIWTCKRQWFDEHGVHFDTEHRNHILWDDVDDLQTKLRARIDATIPQTG